jgi:2'-hydroxyisoflavone reductase
MKLLILGGTRFLGRALVHSAQAHGHQITLFNRGQSNPGLFPEIEQITGDRTTDDILQLRGRTWDAVIDPSGYAPGVVAQSAQLLANATDCYCFISSISVYADVSQPGTAEDAPVERLPEGVDESFRMEYYGALKALCEQTAERILPGKTLIIRPGLIVGEYDLSDRFTYWPWRVAQGGEVLAPGRPDYLTQFIDVRDLADWTLRMLEAHQTGIFNATGPRTPLPMNDLLEACRTVSGSNAQFTWAPEEFLLANGVEPWMEMPLWLPDSDPAAGMNQTSIEKALRHGLTFRPLDDTLRSTLTWANSRPADHAWRAGISLEREKELLQKISASASAG